MFGIKSITLLMRELEQQLAGCIRCGMCQAVCPLFAETGREADVARGKLALLDGLVQKMFKNPRGVFERLNRCLLCGSCAFNCPSGVNALEIFIKARAILTGYMGLNPAKKAILRGVLAHPRSFDRLLEWGLNFQKLLTKPADELIGTSCARLVSPLLQDRHFIPLAPVPFHRMLPSLNTATDFSGIKVAFFVGCLIDKVFPRIAKAVVDVLNHHQVGILIPEDLGCCGIPAISSGDTITFNRLMRYNLEKFRQADFDYLITACATCTTTIRHIWPLMVQDESGDIRADVANIAQKSIDISQFLVSELGVSTDTFNHREAPVPVTYHDPCHLAKSLEVTAAPRALIEANPEYVLNEMAEADRCCGLGGSFSLRYYQIAADIGKRKLENIAATQSAEVATGCPACMIQIADMLSQSKLRMKVKHPVEIYAASLTRISHE